MAKDPGAATRALKHGAEGGVTRITKGQELVGLAADAEQAVYNELEQKGRLSLVIRDAARLQACADLFWNAVQKAAESGDLAQLDHFVARFGWLASSSLRAWQLVHDLEKTPSETVQAIKVLEAVRSGDKQNQ